MLTNVGLGVTTAIQYCGQVLSALVSDNGAMSAVLPVIGLSIGMGVIGFGIAKIKSLVWGM